jgi:hypothetical protein
MARKTLLTESEVRRFMKLANMGPLSSERLDEIGLPTPLGDVDVSLSPGARDEEEVEFGAEEEEMEMPEEEPLDEPLDDLEGEVEGDMDPELEEKLKSAIMAIADEWNMGDMVSVEEVPGEDEEGLEDADLAMDLEMGGPPPEGGEEVEAAALEVEEEPVPGMRNYQEALVKKVAQRVAARLMQENKNEKLATELTERIFNRITSK